eukprot:6382993-Alexandrium_andersonii.AAC.1
MCVAQRVLRVSLSLASLVLRSTYAVQDVQIQSPGLFQRGSLRCTLAGQALFCRSPPWAPGKHVGCAQAQAGCAAWGRGLWV